MKKSITQTSWQYDWKFNKMKVYHLLLIVIELIQCNAFSYLDRPHLQNRPIVGGVDAQITNIPYQVSLGRYREITNYDEKGNVENVEYVYRHFCGGSIISVEWVLTAAHCVYIDPDYYGRPREIRVRVGSDIRNEGGKLHKVAKIIYHPEFNFKTLDKDVGVIKVTEPFEFGPTVQSIPLTQYPNVPGAIVTVSGWGTTTEYGDLPTKLQKVQIPILPQWECQMYFNPHEIPITDYMFCAGRGGRSSCHGDSGGPVVYNGFQIGIVSWGRSCQRPDFPAVAYASVLNLRDWIHKHSGV